MKKLIVSAVIIPVLIMLFMPVNATEITVNSDESENILSEEEYIPEYVLEIIEANGADTQTYADYSVLVSFCLSVLKESVISYSDTFLNIMAIVFIMAIFKKINDNNSILMIASLVFTAVIAKEFLVILSGLFQETHDVLNADKQIISLTLPSVITVLLMGGGSVSAVGSSASFASVLSLLEIALSEAVSVMITAAAVLLIFEKLSPAFSEINCSKFVKKYTVMFLTFITSLMITVVTYQTVLNAKTDSLTTRTVKFAASNFIPIVGSAVGESYKSISAGVSYLKTSLGGITSAAVFFTFVPIVVNIAVIKIFLSFAGFTASLCGCSDEKNFFDGILNIIDILFAIIICSAILSFMLMFLFAFVSL